MGLFDRLGNLGKGMVAMMKKGGKSAPTVDLDAELARRPPARPVASAPPVDAEQAEAEPEAAAEEQSQGPARDEDGKIIKTL